jgi:hypothetical protein
MTWKDAEFEIENMLVIRGATDDEVLLRRKRIRDLLIKHGQVRARSAAQSNENSPAATEAKAPTGPPLWNGQDPDANSPDVVLCNNPEHEGKEMKKRGPNKSGYWYSHKTGTGSSDWCYGIKARKGK